MAQLVIEAIIAGFGYGSIYAIIAVGYTLILGSSGVFNFAQGSAVMAGALVSYGVGTVEHVPLLVLVGVVMLTGAVAGLLSHTIAVLPLTNRAGVTSLTFGTFLSTLGLGLALNSIIGLAYGTATVGIVKFYVSQHPIVIGTAHIVPIYLVMFCSTVLVVIAFELVNRRTGAGLVMRAVFNDNEGAALAGVSISRVVRRVFMFGCMLAAVAGLLIAPITEAKTTIANQYAFYGFAAMAVGGYGSFPGAVCGGILVGLVGEVPLIWVNPLFSDAMIYGFMLLLLLFRPQGLFGSGGSTFGAAALRDV